MAKCLRCGAGDEWLQGKVKTELKKMRKVKQLESSIESSCRVYAHDRGWTSRKMNGLGFRSWPDRFFLPRASSRGTKKRFWVEFKRPGEKSTPDQARMQRDLRSRGETVYECDSREKFIRIFNEHN